MKVSIPPRFGVAAAAGAAMAATQRAAPRPAAANPDFLIISFLLLLLDHFPAKHAAVHRGNATPRRDLTHLAAGHPVAGSHLPELRTDPAAALDRHRAARMKRAARRRIDRAGHLP